MKIKYFFDIHTSTLTYIIIDMNTKKCAIIDPVLDYNHALGYVNTKSADLLISYVKKYNLDVQWILETHIHADHLTSAHYLKQKLGGKIGIGEYVKKIIDYWVSIFNTAHDTPLDGSQFDYLWQDNEQFNIGTLPVRVMHTPGHTPACICYLINDYIFSGDTIFSPNLGTARADFPGGNAKQLYHSVQKILKLPSEAKIYHGHDYPKPGESVNYVNTVIQQKTENIMVHTGITETEYVKIRNSRDTNLLPPRLLLPSLQVNLRAGSLGACETNKVHYLKIPIRYL